ncbi:hypothetical protein [Caenimonas aquaedulcis]|uniref:Uncharacterized protein n=1 Tax=Caenimonas aquaedulcis TaxID=2793270 RepID=A0A931H4L4_9BURK|nr:hypothetical protein [Caenimonas aquaedulcis]MBG9388407.1 hypothetical protein [Caenimonas aquaedulcis]
MSPKIPGGRPARPIEDATRRTEQVQKDLAVSSADLHLTNTILTHSLPDPLKKVEVRKALEQNVAVEEKVAEAAEELAEVTELLHEEVAQRRHLERQLHQRGA